MHEVVDRAVIKRKLAEFSAFWGERIASWHVEGTESGSEKRHAQQFWSDLMRCFDINPERIDVFERNADRGSTGGAGFIDFFWSGVVIGEAKSLGKNLDVAYEQAMDYLNGGTVSSHEWPRFIIATDFENIRLDRLGEDSWTLRFTIDQVPDHLEQLLFFAGVEALTKREQENASIEAAKLMANLFNALAGEEADEEVGDDAPTTAEEEDDDTELASVLMTRLLFLLYGDDAGLWEQDLFFRWIDSVASKNIGPALDGLFNVLNENPGTRRKKYRGNLPDLESRFPYVNGGVFDGTGQVGYSVPAEFKEVLLDAARFRWTSISPAIFGAMFQLVKSKDARRGDGEHYTSEKNILKTLGPLFLDDYRKEADRLISETHQVAPLRRLQQQIASNIYIDPACGAGNFLNVAYAQLRQIETDLIVERRRREGTITGTLDSTLDQLLTIDKFYGFELNWWPAKIAETAMFLVDQQANRELAARTGQAPDRLPITITAKIIHGNALDLDWNAELPVPDGKTFVFGNPPFIGQYTKTPVQTEDMRRVWGKDYDGYLDYVTAWHAKSKDLLAERPGEFAYVTTNSISQGQPVPALFGPLYRDGWSIKFAHRTFAWDSEAPGKAAVHCVIVGFTKDKEPRRRLWDYAHVSGDPEPQRVTNGINAYLIDGPSVLIRKSNKPLSPALPPMTRGAQPTDGGHLTFKASEGTRGLDQDPIAAKYLRRLVGSVELINDIERWCLWLEDLTSKDLRASKNIRDAVEGCHRWRVSQPKTGDAYKLKDTPHLFRPTPFHPAGPYLCVPKVVSKRRRYWTAKRFMPDVIATDLVFIAPDEDGLLFSLVSSSMFMTWQRTVGGRLKSDYRLSSTVTWNTFPVPDLEEATRQRIIDAGQKILLARDERPDQSLADLYDPYLMGGHKGLQRAHNTLDTEVDKAFGSSSRLTGDKQRLELLFPAYQRLTSDPGGAPS
ncbi:DNA methyltransferase [Nesterenkonia natronophila]|uniref:site-specific DNA-methyltransferase (adenine-specific) n=1 Tax=Nesterenkonia natronophila TaxID=2174932 RepID=A0A3A4F6L8_9MICC|nr:DNA methyltransferase [Nesterenkonia natronophila]RJN32130.1 SAM-dependent DNA methyltransferase [Nesterenkonia natronophila]